MKRGSAKQEAPEDADPHVPKKPRMTDLVCGECSRTAEWHCKECGMDLCGVCDSSIHSFKVSTGHRRVDVTDKWKLANQSCAEHSAQQVMLYCVTCSKCICLICKDPIVGSHSSHNMKRLQEVVDDKKRAAADLLVDFQSRFSKGSEMIQSFRFVSSRLLEIADALDYDSLETQAVIKDLGNELQTSSATDPLMFLAVWDSLQSKLSQMSDFHEREQDHLQQARECMTNISVMIQGSSESSRQAKKFEWGRKGAVKLSGLRLCGQVPWKTTYVPAMRKKPVVVEEKSGVKDYWEAQVEGNALGGHTMIGIGDSEVPLDCSLGLRGRAIGFQHSSCVTSNTELQACRAKMIGNDLSYKIGDFIGLMIDCTGSPLLRGFVNRKQVFCMPFPKGTWYPAFCVANGSLIVTDNPNVNTLVWN
eukprot:TRINITY_DN12774_c0_g2_i1.p1 TRINITY_DN12774_c0_g2~~TRINITY_DN12774_c0_g2_i1.p1  ORF type:complete len:418 (+),score=77.17 TRINITY_DN12774_c0_g2_i1:105-1358(+)